MGGVRIKKGWQFIGKRVYLDTVCPDLITIGRHCHITNGVIFLTHYLDTDSSGINWKYGEITIGDNVFIGMNAIIAKPLTIGDGAIIGAGSVVTKNIPANEIWAGNPARFIKKRSTGQLESRCKID